MRWTRVVASLVAVTIVSTALTTVATSTATASLLPDASDPVLDLPVTFPEPMDQPPSAGALIPPPNSDEPAPTGHAVTGAMPADDLLPTEGWSPYRHWKANGDGTVTSRHYLAPEFRRSGATWLPIDTTVRPSVNLEFPVAAPDALHPVRFGNAASRLLRLELAGGDVTVQAPGLDIAAPLIVGSEVRYLNVATDTDLVYRVTRGGIVKELVLKSASAPRSFVFRVNDPADRLGGVEPIAGGGARFTNEVEEETHLEIPAPFAYERAGAGRGMVARNLDSASMTVAKSGAGYDVTVAVDEAWLEGREYPVVLDPQLVYNGNAVDASHVKSTRNCGADGGGCSPNTADISNGAGTYTDSLDDIRPGRSLFKYSVSSIPEGSVVNSASIAMWIGGCMGNDGNFLCDTNSYTLQFGRMNGTWDSNTAWRDMPSFTVASSTGINPWQPLERFQLSFDIKSLVTPWVNRTMTNYGMNMKLSSEPTTGSIGGPIFESANSSLTTRRPVITIDYSPPPNPPTNVSLAKTGPQSLNATWTAPASNGGPSVSSYKIQLYRSDNTLYTTGTCTAPCTSKSFSSVPYGTYYAKVIAVNSVGDSDPSAASSSVTLAPTPDLTKTVSPARATYTKGEQLTYTLTVNNPGPATMTVTGVTDNLPSTISTTGTTVTRDGAPCGTLCTLTGTTLSVGTFTIAGNSSTSFVYRAIATGTDRLCEVANNTATATNSLGSDTASASVTICDAGLGVESWWTYASRPLSSTQTARVNVANGNLVVQATDSTPIQARGRLGYVLRRTYNSQDTTVLSLPGSIGAGWLLNVGQTDDLAGDGITATSLYVPPASSITDKLGVTLIDRDGTRHVFQLKGANVNIDVTGAYAPGMLGALVPQALKLGSGYNRVCVDATYKAPPGVHLGLWRYIAVNSSSGSCTPAAGTTPVVLGFAAERPDRIRYEFSATGRMVSMTDGAGVELRYLYENEPLPGVEVGRLTAVYEPRSCTTTGSGASGIPSWCRAFRFTYLTNEVDVTDPAGRVTKYFTDGTPTTPRLVRVVNPDGSELKYTYQSNAYSGEQCGGSANQMCSAVDTRGYATRFTYGTASRGLNRVVSTTDRRGTVSSIVYNASPEYVTIDRSGQRRRFTNIDATGRVGEILEGDTADVFRHQTHYYWDTAAAPCRKPDNAVDNNLCKVIRRAAPSATSSLATAGAAGDEETSFTYNAEGMPLSQQQANHGRTPATLTTTWGYHAQYVESGGGTTHYYDNVAGSGNVTSTGTVRETATSLYAISDRTQVLPPRGNETGAAYASYVTTYDVADSAGTNPNSVQTTSCTLRNSGHVCEEIAPSYNGVTATRTTYAYDAFGQRTSMTTPKAKAECCGSYVYTYFSDSDRDLSGNVTTSGWLRAVTDPRGEFVAFGYDRAGNVARTWDRNATGSSISSYPGSTSSPPTGYTETRYSASATWYRDPWRHLRAQRTQTGSTTTYTVDPEGNATAIRPPRGNAGTASYDVVSTFDGNGNPLTVLLPQEAAAGRATTYAYDAHDNRVSVTDPNGSVATTRYDSVNRATGTAFTRGPWPTDTSTVPPACRQSVSTDAPIAAGHILCDTTVSYDGVDNTTSTSAPDDQVTTFAFDSVHREVRRDTPRYDGTFTTLRSEQLYDADGRVTTTCPPREFTEGAGTCTATGLYSTHHTYDVLGRLRTTKTFRAPSATANTTSVEYDADGNTVKATDANGRVNTATYDLLGRRLTLTVPRSAGVANTTHWTYDAVGNVTSVVRPAAVSNGDGRDGDLVVDGSLYPASAPYRLAHGKQYRNVTLRNGGWIAADPMSLGGSGRLEFRVQGKLTVCGYCGLSVAEAGPAGGAGALSVTSSGSAGEGSGPGAGGQSSAVAGGGGGGAGHLGYGGSGGTATGGGAGGNGGQSYGTGITGQPGTAEMGSGGGGGGAGGVQPGGAGGAGGGFMHVTANEIVVENGGQLRADGASGASVPEAVGGVSGAGGGAGGGGSGGSIWLTANVVNVQSGYWYVTLNGGWGGSSVAGNGGPGSNGRLRVDAAVVDGQLPQQSGGYFGGADYMRTELGLVTLYSYDAANRLVDTVEGATSRTFSQTGTASADGGSDIRTRRVYDADGRVAGVYEPRAFATSVSDPDERFLTRTDFDLNGRPSAFFVPRYDSASVSDPGLSGSATQTSQCPVNPATQSVAGLPAYPSTVGVCVTRTEYDFNGNRSRVVTPRPNGVTSFAYTDDNLLASVEVPNPAGASGSRVTAQTYAYDASGRPVKVTDSLTHQTVTEYFADGLTKKVTAHPNGTLEHVTSFSYDASGNATKQVQPVTLDGVLTNVESRTVYTSDGLVAEVDAPGSSTARAVTRYTYDNVGNHLTVASPTATAATAEATNPNRLVTSYTYTDDNLLLTQTQPVKADRTSSRRTKYGYDPAGRKVAQTVALVDAVGNVTDDGKTQAFAYYPSDREHRQTGRNGETITTLYDAAGNPRSVTDSTSGTVTATFYLDGLVRSVTAAGRTTLQTYDGSGNRAARADVVDATGARTVTRYAHNEAGLPSGMTTDLTGSAWSWTYDVAGRLTQEDQPNGNKVVLQQNPDDTLSSLQLLGSDGASLAAYTYTYDEMYRERTQNLTATAASPGNVVGGSQQFTYYAGGQLKSYTDGTGTKTATWDSDGNRLSFGPATFEYNVDGSILRSRDSASAPWRTYLYEAFGGVKDDGCTVNSYDGFDRLSSAAGKGTTGCSGDRTEYTYDGLDRQVSRTDKAGTANALLTAAHYDGSSGLRSVSVEGGTDIAYALSPVGEAKASVKRTASPVAHFLTGDGQGSVTLAHGASGAAACTARFDPFGTPLSPQVGVTHPCSSGSSHNDVFYKGARRDQSTGTYQMGSRTYDPAKASFLQPDTYRSAAPSANLGLGTDPMTRNRYAFVNGDPVNLVDPTGHFGCWKFCGAVKAVASVAVETVQTTVEAAQWTYDKVETAVEYVGARVTGFVSDRVDDIRDEVRMMRAAAAKMRDVVVDGAKKVGQAAVKTVKVVKKAAVATGNAVVSGVSYCLGRGARTCAAVAGGIALAATGVGAIAGTALLAGTALAGAAGTISTIATAATIASGAFSLVSYKNTGNKMDLLNAALAFAGPLAKGTRALRGTRVTSGTAAGGSGAATAARSCAVNSFTASTPVLMASGAQKPISDVEIGDSVLATDPETGETAPRPVTQLIVHGGRHVMVDVTLADGTTINATDRHPFWNATTQRFEYAEELVPGQQVRLPDGSLISITDVRIYEDDDVTAYNLTVDDIHTYYAGTTPVLVHNSCGEGGRLFRFGTAAESADDLAAQAAKAEAAGFPHGVSVRSATNRLDIRSALRTDVESVFNVIKTGRDSRHYTVELPKPVTDDVAELFNSLFRR